MMYAFEQTFRWFGPDDPVTLSDIKMTGATGVVTALHHVPIGEIWTVDEILDRKKVIEEAGLHWSVVESIPVHEDIKLRQGNFQEYIEHYKKSIENLAYCGIRNITYNFMPVLDWTRTRLDYKMSDGSTGLRYDRLDMAAFELYILQRNDAWKDYSENEQEKAKEYFLQLSENERQKLTDNIIAGLPGGMTLKNNSLEAFKNRLETYKNVSTDELRKNLFLFIQAIAPIASSHNCLLSLHPDDPPYPIFGLPRVVSTASDLEQILSTVPLESNGWCFCSGSFGVRPDNDLERMIQKFGNRIHFVHLRNIIRTSDGSFFESDHLNGDLDMPRIMQALILQMQQRKISLPLRPDHGHNLMDDLIKKTNPGYSGIGRMRGLAELRGLELGLSSAFNHL